MPITQLGKYSLTLLTGSILFFVLAMISIASGQRGGDTFFDNLWISIPMFLAGITIIASFLFGFISIVKDNERSLFVFICCLIGFFVLIFLAGEFLFPH